MITHLNKTTMTLFRQGDPRWSWRKIGTSVWTLAQKGCVTTDISMITSYFKKEVDPGQAVQKLIYTHTGLLMWPSIHILGLKFLWRMYPANFNQGMIDEAMKNPKKACLLNVMGGAHWVLGIYRVPLTRNYWVVDPLTGTRKFYSGVIGAAIVENA